jgi:TonB family protein
MEQSGCDTIDTMRYRVTSVALTLFLLGVPALQAKDAKWFEMSSEHFLLFTDTNEAKGRRLISDFENRVTVFAQALGKVPPRQFPIEVFLFNNDQDFIEALPHAKGGEEELRKAAYLLRGPDRVFVVAKDKSPDDIANDVGHALGHVLFERYVMWRPFWLAEGAAELVRKTGRSPDSKPVSEQDGFGADDLVTIVPSATYNDNDPGGAFRTQSYRLLRIVLDDKADILRKYVQSLRVESERAPRIDLDTQALDSTLKSYVEKPLTAPPVTALVKSAEADPARLAIHHGDLLLATDRQADAGRYYNADSKDARAARAIITRFSRSGAEAARVLDRAARELPDVGLVQYHFGAMDLQDKKDIHSQVAALERAVQLLPLMGRAYGDLARVYALDGQPEKSLPAITKALELEPEFADRFIEIRSEADLALGQADRALRDINLASDLPHSDRSVLERYPGKILTIRKKIEAARREIDAQDLEKIRQQVREEERRREPPPKPSAPPPPVPAGSISYQIETRAPIEVVETVYPEYSDALRRNGAAGVIALRVDVGPDGKVKTATIASSQIADLNNATLEAVKKWSFKPGNRSIRIVLTFSLQ